MIGAMMPRMPSVTAAAALAGLVGLVGLQPVARAEQWAYAMQTGHGNHSIQVDVDSLAQEPGYLAARLLFEYYWNATNMPDPASGPAPRSALVDGAFDCKGRQFQVLSRTEYAAPEAQGTAGATTRSVLAADRWRSASADPETYAIIDWVCSVAAHKLK